MLLRCICCALVLLGITGLAATVRAQDDENAAEGLVVPEDDAGAAEEGILPPYDEGREMVVEDGAEPSLQDDAAAEPAPLMQESYGPGAGYVVNSSPIPPLNYNYWYPAYPSGTLPARLYLCPRPVPVFVGYTYITYQPLAPHEFMWRHERCYYRYHPGSGTTVTRIKYR